MTKRARIAFSGSGFLAPIHVGAICAFLDCGYQIVEVAGSSGGSIAAALIASGATYSQIKAIALAELPDDMLNFEPLSLLANQGFNDGSVLLDWLVSILGNRKFANAIVPITVMATDINGGRECRFNAKGTPDVRIADACRASASVPFVFAPHTIAGVKCVDAGVACNLPVDELVIDDVPRFGIKVIDGSSVGKSDTYLGLIEQTIGTMMAANEENLTQWAQSTGATIIPVSATPYGFLNSKLTLSEKTDLFDRGYSSVKSMFPQA